MNPLVYLVSMVIGVVNFALLVWIVLSLLVTFNIVNRWHPVVGKVHDALNRLFEPLLRPIRKYIPDLGGIDISPIVLIILLKFIDYTVHYLFAPIPKVIL